MKKSLLIVLSFIVLTSVVFSSFSIFNKAYADTSLNVAISEGYFRGIPAEMTLKAFKGNFNNVNDWNWKIYPADASTKYDYLTESNNNPIYTGCTFRIEVSFANVESYEIVVLGDVNGDGYVNHVDYVLLKSHIKKLGGTNLTGAF